MKIMKTFVTILIISHCGAACIGQTGTFPLETTPVGRTAVEGIQLSASVTNDVVRAGSKITLSLKITNSSPYTIRMTQVPYSVSASTDPSGSSGKAYGLAAERPPVAGHALPIDMTNGEIREWNVTVDVQKEIEPGDYTLKVSQPFSITANHFWVYTTLKVRID
jgi:hypothetical protein